MSAGSNVCLNDASIYIAIQLADEALPAPAAYNLTVSFRGGAAGLCAASGGDAI